MTCWSWMRSPVIIGRSSANSDCSTIRFLCRSPSESATTSRVTSFMSSGSRVNSFLVNKARSRVITSDARLPSRKVRLAVSRAPSTSGGLAASIRRQVPALVMMPGERLVDLMAIDAVNALTVVSRATWASSKRAVSRRRLCHFALGHILKRADEHRSTLDLLDHMGDAAHMFHSAAGGHDPESKSDVHA